MPQFIEPPFSKESEMMVLGCMLTNIESLVISCRLLAVSDFYLTEHKNIFQGLKSIWEAGGVGDVHLTCQELKKNDKLESVGGAAYVTGLAQYAGTSAYIEAYIDELKDYANRRRILDLSLDLQKRASSNEKPQKIIISAQESLKLIEQNRGTQDKFPIKFLEQLDKNFLLTEPPNKPMLLEYVDENKMPIGFLPKGIATMIVGAGGVGKTHLLAQLAISVSTGTTWLDTYRTTEHCGDGKKGNVFFGLGENQLDDIHRVLYKAAKKLRRTRSDLLNPCLLSEATKRIAPFSFCGQQAAFIEDKKPSLYFRQLKMKLAELSPKDGWSLIILDPISRLMGSDAETDNAAATQFIALLEELTIDLPGNPTILFAHHVTKSAINSEEKQNQTAARGASALTDGVRLQLNLSKNFTSGLLQLTMTKSNFTKIMEAISLKQDFEGFVEHCSEAIIKNKPKKSSQTYADEYAGG